MNIQRSRMITKKNSNTGVVPTIPLSNDHTDGSWLTTDIYDGEMFLNTTDQKMWYRAGNVIKEVSVNSASTLNDLSDVVITAPALNETLIYTSANTWENGLISSFNTLIDVDYALLVSSITYSLLIPGNFYRLTDYQTIHLIPDTTDINTGPIESLILFAIRDAEISPHAISQFNNGFFNIEYNHSDNIAEDGITPRPGYIIYRKSIITNVEAYCDYVNYIIRRYPIIQDGSYDWDSAATYVVGDIVEYITNNFLYFCYNDVTSAGTDPETDNKHWIKVADLSINNCLFALGQKIGNTTLNLDATYYDWNIFNTSNVTNISLGYESNDNLFYGSFFQDIKIGSNCNRNTFHDNLNSSTTTAIIEMGYNCNSNFITDSVSLTLGNNCNYNVLSDGANNNILNSASVSNIIGSGSTYNTFGYGNLRNYIGNLSTHNKFGDTCKDNILNTGCVSNKFGYNCNSNILGSGCYSINFGDGCSVNTFGENCNINTFGENCYYNIFVDDCNFNIFNNINNIDFTSATHVYNDYTCELFTRQDGTAKLKYVNNSDVQVIVNATA